MVIRLTHDQMMIIADALLRARQSFKQDQLATGNGNPWDTTKEADELFNSQDIAIKSVLDQIANFKCSHPGIFRGSTCPKCDSYVT